MTSSAPLEIFRDRVEAQRRFALTAARICLREQIKHGTNSWQGQTAIRYAWERQIELREMEETLDIAYDAVLSMYEELAASKDPGERAVR